MKDKIFSVLQRVGRSFMLPIAILPIAGLFLGIGGSFTNQTMVEAYGLTKILGEGTALYAFLTVLNACGNIVFANLPILFAMGVAIGMAKKEKEVAVATGEKCPKCGSDMVFRKNKKGETFEACSNFPKCKYIKGSEEKPEPTFVDKKCPKCGSPLILKKGVKGRSSFLGCSNFPKCRYIEPYKE